MRRTGKHASDESGLSKYNIIGRGGTLLIQAEKHRNDILKGLRDAIKDVGARGFTEMRLLASMTNWARKFRVNSSGYPPSHWELGKGYK